MVFRSRNIHTKKGIMITKKILVTPGDGIGPEVTKQAIHVLKTVAQRFELQLELSEKPVGHSDDNDLANTDDEWTFIDNGDGTGTITHQRADNSRYTWAYSSGVQEDDTVFGDDTAIGTLGPRVKYDATATEEETELP